MMKIKQMPTSERPRERLERFGTQGLSAAELLAILLGSGTKTCSVMQLAQNLLAHFKTIQALSTASIQELKEVKGIGTAKAILLHAAFAIASRKEEMNHEILDTPEKIYSFIRQELESQETEVLLVVLRDIKLQCIHREILAKGTLTELILHPREIFHVAIKHRAHSVVLAHNHPSGDPTPSQRDLAMTERLAAIGNVMGIPLSDHLIIGKKKFYSLFLNNRSIFV